MRLSLFAAVLALSCSPPSFAQEAPTPDVWERGCGDDDGNDRCDPAVQDRMLALYGLESPEALLARAVTMRRAMFVDGYGNDVAAITFWREPGSGPMVEVRSPREEGGAEPQPLRAAVSGETWDEVLASSIFFDRELAPEAPPPGEAAQGASFPNICLHAWVAVVAAVDAPRVSPNIVFGTGSLDAERDSALPVEVTMTPASLRSDTETACGAGLATHYAHKLAKIALDQLPECSSLDLGDFRNEAHLLGLCHRLRGDRLVAGEASVIPGKLRQAQRNGSARELGWLFAGTGGERPTRYLAAIEGGDAYFQPPLGIDADHAVIEGEIVWTAENGPPVERAALRLNLLRVTGDFVIDTFEVSERRPYER